MESESTPLPEPGSSLVPPPRQPPTALAAATPNPPRRPRNPLERFRDDPRTKRFVDNAITAIFDRADELGDGIARALGLRPQSSVVPVAPATPPARSDAVD